MAEDQQEFLRLLRTLLSSDNTIRGNAETTLDGISVETRATYFLAAMQDTTVGEDVRQMAAVLLRQLISNDSEDFYNQLIPEHQIHLKNELLETIQTEIQAGLRWKIFEVASELARQLLDEEGNNLWPEFLRFLFESASSGTPEIKESALQMIGSIPGILGNQQSRNEESLKTILKDCLAASSSYSVRFQAAKTFSSYILHKKNDVIMYQHFEELTAGVIQIVAESIQKQQDQSLLKCVLDMALLTPALFRMKINILLKKCMQAVDNDYLPDSWRLLALEIIVTLTETAPEYVLERGITLFPLIIPTVLTMMTELDGDESVVNVNSKTAETALVRLARGIGSEYIYPHLIQRLPVMLTNTDWRVRHAGITAICVVGECCQNEMKPILNGILEHILNFLRDEEPAVRLAACSGVVKMLNDFYPSLHLNYHQQIIPKLLAVMDDVNGRVQAEGTYAVIIFCEKCPKKIINLYGNRITRKLEELGFTWALNKIRSFMGQIADCVPQSAILQSKNVEIIRKNDHKFYKQRLFGFLTQFAGTSCTIKCDKRGGRYHATLIVYGEAEPVVGVDNHRIGAEITACIKYINPQVVNRCMTWGFLPDINFNVMKNRILTGLQQFGNYHPQVVVREMYRWFKFLKWDVNPKGQASCYTCSLQVRKNATEYEEEESGNTVMEAKVATFMQMAQRLYNIGVLPKYSPANIVVAIQQRPVGVQSIQQRPAAPQSMQQHPSVPHSIQQRPAVPQLMQQRPTVPQLMQPLPAWLQPLPAWLQPMQQSPAVPMLMQQRPVGPPNVQQQRQPGPGQHSRNVITVQLLQGMAQRPGH